MEEPKHEKSKKAGKKKKRTKVQSVEKLRYRSIEEIRNMENKSLQSIITSRAYLEQYCTPIIQEAMISCLKNKPSNPLEYIGNFILQRSHGIK